MRGCGEMRRLPRAVRNGVIAVEMQRNGIIHPAREHAS